MKNHKKFNKLKNRKEKKLILKNNFKKTLMIFNNNKL